MTCPQCGSEHMIKNGSIHTGKQKFLCKTCHRQFVEHPTREIVGAYVGSRDRDGAQGLWDSLPPVYRQCAVAYTDFWAPYASVFPTKRHKSVGKDSGHTSHIERLNGTIRQRVSRLVRKMLSFSKKVSNHIGALWNFIHHSNQEIAACC